ncbi:MAG: PfkB family carbohydrate kinase [Candidatus Cryptobacteroides sp.]
MIIGIGETVLDIVFKCGQPKSAVPGGSTFNSMISLGRTAGKLFPEVPLVMVTRVGRDMVGDIILSFMRENNVRTDAVECLEGVQSTVSIAMLDERNDARYEFFRDTSAPAFESCGIEFHPGDLVLFGSFFAINKGTREVTRELVTRARAAGAIIYYDINFRRSHLLDLPATKSCIEENCALSDIVRGSSEDISYIYGTEDAALVYRDHISSLCGTFICTKGAGQTEVFSDGRSCVFDVEKIQTVSTIGAGDSFNAGILFGLLKEGFTKEKVARLEAEDWEKLVPAAAKFSANVCRSMDNYVDRDFLENVL